MKLRGRLKRFLGSIPASRKLGAWTYIDEYGVRRVLAQTPLRKYVHEIFNEAARGRNLDNLTLTDITTRVLERYKEQRKKRKQEGETENHIKEALDNIGSTGVSNDVRRGLGRPTIPQIYKIIETLSKINPTIVGWLSNFETLVVEERKRLDAAGSNRSNVNVTLTDNLGGYKQQVLEILSKKDYYAQRKEEIRQEKLAAAERAREKANDVRILKQHEEYKRQYQYVIEMFNNVNEALSIVEIAKRLHVYPKKVISLKNKGIECGDIPPKVLEKRNEQITRRRASIVAPLGTRAVSEKWRNHFNEILLLTLKILQESKAPLTPFSIEKRLTQKRNTPTPFTKNHRLELLNRDLVTVKTVTEGSNTRFLLTITPEGRKYLEENRGGSSS